MIFGVDIGGVNFKITSLTQTNKHLKVKSALFPFIGKTEMIEKLILHVSHPDLVVITQTFCANRQLFSSAKEGTHYIVDITENLFGGKVKYLGLSYRLYNAEEAKKDYLKVAARNWVATCYLTFYLKLFENGLVIDCGTNSTDIVPVLDSKPVTLDDNDREYTRLKTGELFWSGLYFTQIPSISNTVVLDGERFQVKPSTNARIFDAYILLGIVSPGDIIERYGSWQKGMSSISFESCADRILDTICADKELLTANDAKKIAQFLVEKQRENTEKTIKKILSAAKKKYEVDLKVAAIAGAGKNLILRKALENLAFEEIIDIEKAASETLDMVDSQSNCETSLGCALMGLQEYKRNFE